MVSTHTTSTIATATVIEGGLVTTDDQRLIIDHSKVFRAQTNIIIEFKKNFGDLAWSGEINPFN